MSDKKWLVPDVVDPAEKVCVRLEIPKDVKHIAAFWGALEQLSKAYNWEDSYDTGSDTAYVWRDIIEAAAGQVQIGENCMLDCEDVEDCLETSTIITTIEADIVINEGDIVTNTTNITEIVTNPPDGNVYPDAPTIETDPACGAAFYIVAAIRAFILDAEGWNGTYTDETDTLENIIDVFAWQWSWLYDLLAYLFDPSPPASVLTDYDAQQDDMRQQLYCTSFDKPLFVTYVRTLTNGNAIADFIDCIALSTWSSWHAVGQSDLTQDCEDLCPPEGWGNDFDFTIEAYEWVQRDPNDGEHIAGNYWQSQQDIYTSLTIDLWLPSPVTITRVRVEYDQVIGWGSNHNKTVLTNGIPETVETFEYQNFQGAGVQDDSGEWGAIEKVSVVIRDVDETLLFRCARVTIYGEGINPELGVDI